jgi:hypothetical protein
MSRVFASLFALSLVASSAACGAIYPQYATSVLDAPPGMAEGGEISPPPEDLVRVAAQSAEIPELTRDSHTWDGDGGPDPYVVMLRNDREVYRSRVMRDSTHPSWTPASDFADLRIEPTDRIHIELRDDDGLSSDVIGVYDGRGLPPEARGGEWLMRFERGASLTLSVGTPTPHLGMGVRYEVHSDRLVVLSVEYGSAARVAGLRVGDRILAINGRAISSSSEGEVRQGMDRNATQDVSLTVQHEGATATEQLTIRRDALYPSR